MHYADREGRESDDSDEGGKEGFLIGERLTGQGGGTIHTFYRFRSTFAFVIESTISSSKIISSTQNRVYSICIYNM